MWEPFSGPTLARDLAIRRGAATKSEVCPRSMGHFGGDNLTGSFQEFEPATRRADFGAQNLPVACARSDPDEHW